jgi:hypothetical protein
MCGLIREWSEYGSECKTSPSENNYDVCSTRKILKLKGHFNTLEI